MALLVNSCGARTPAQLETLGKWLSTLAAFARVTHVCTKLAAVVTIRSVAARATGISCHPCNLLCSAMPLLHVCLLC
jgi:hypothetical protein